MKEYLGVRDLWLREVLAQKTTLEFNEWKKTLTPEYLKKHKLFIKKKKLRSLISFRGAYSIISEYQKTKHESIFNLLYGKVPSYKKITFLNDNKKHGR
jgi:hypothetical protein